jgi:integrase
VPACPFVFHHGGQPVVTFYRAWDAAAEAIGYGGRDADGKRRLRFHDLRRSAAVLLRQSGVDPAVVQARGGWKTARMFERYSALFNKQEQVRAQAALDAARQPRSTQGRAPAGARVAC